MGYSVLVSSELLIATVLLFGGSKRLPFSMLCFSNTSFSRIFTRSRLSVSISFLFLTRLVYLLQAPPKGYIFPLILIRLIVHFLSHFSLPPAQVKGSPYI